MPSPFDVNRAVGELLEMLPLRHPARRLLIEKVEAENKELMKILGLEPERAVHRKR